MNGRMTSVATSMPIYAKEKRRRPFIIAAFSIIAVLLPLLMVPNNDRSFDPVILLPLLTLVYSSWRVSNIATDSARPKLISMTYWIYVYVFFGVCGLLQVSVQSFPWTSAPYDSSNVFFSYFIIWVGLIAFDIGSRQNLLRFTKLTNHLLRRRLSALSSRIILITGVISSAGLIAITLGFSRILASRDERYSTLSGNVGGDGLALLQLIVSLIQAPTFVATLSLLALYRSPIAKLKRSIALRFILIAGVTWTVYVNNPISCARFWAGTVLISMAMIFLRSGRPGKPLLAWAAGLMMAFVFVFPFSDLFRITTTQEIAPDELFSGLGTVLTRKGDFDSLEQLGNSVRVVSKDGLYYGNQLLSSFFFWVPRSVWPSKSKGAGGAVAEAMDMKFTNLSMPLWGEFYLDGGLVLVAAGFFFYGVLVRVLERSFVDSSYPTFATVITPLYAAFQFFLLRGSLLSAIASFSTVLVVLVACTKRPTIRKSWYLR